MRAQDDSRDVALLGSQVTGVEAVKLFLILTERHAWHNTWCGRYEGPAALHCGLHCIALVGFHASDHSAQVVAVRGGPAG